METASGGGIDLNYACETRRSGDRQALFAHAFKMKLDGLLDEVFHFIP